MFETTYTKNSYNVGKQALEVAQSMGHCDAGWNRQGKNLAGDIGRTVEIEEVEGENGRVEERIMVLMVIA
jgi:hypothetical protein